MNLPLIDIISWIIHFVIFFVLARWSGIKVWWAVGLTFGIEMWEMLDWSLDDPLAWWGMLDTWMDILFGCIGIYIAKKL